MLNITFPNKKLNGRIEVGGSKSESNRLLILAALSDGQLKIERLSDSNDTELMLAALAQKEEVIDVGPAGTTSRFLTAYLANLPGTDHLLKGSARLHERPIGELVEALRKLGADISYEENEGFLPLRIKGKKLKGGATSIDAGTSSQFITALLLIGSQMERGLELELNGELVSVPYIKMTLALLERCGIGYSWNENIITIAPQKIAKSTVRVEADWSSASYYFALASLSEEAEIRLSSYLINSLQGDSKLVELYKQLGVRSRFEGDEIILSKNGEALPKHLELDLEDTPDIAQTIAVTMAGHGLKGRLTGLKTLRIKETDRIAALCKELAKFGVETNSGPDFLEITGYGERQKNIEVHTYHDHRMAMAFAPMALFGKVGIEDPDVVIKSYPRFWEDLKKLGAQIEQVP